MSFAQLPDFTCVICDYNIDMRWEVDTATQSLDPICRGCESAYGRHRTLDGAGAFRDRRMAIQIEALASALECAAHMQLHKGKYHAEP